MAARSRFSPTALKGFELVFRPWMARRIRAVRIAGLPAQLPPDRPVIFAPNHVSWWDGFLILEVRRSLRLDAPLFTFMNRRELHRFPFFRRLGALDVDVARPGGALGAFRAILDERRRRPDIGVLIFPQGRIWPSHRRPLGFRRGVERLARLLHPATVLPIGIHLEPLNSPAPTAFLSAGPALPTGRGPTYRSVERAVEEELDRVLAFLGRYGEDAPAGWPSAFERLPPAAGSPAAVSPNATGSPPAAGPTSAAGTRMPGGSRKPTGPPPAAVPPGTPRSP